MYNTPGSLASNTSAQRRSDVGPVAALSAPIIFVTGASRSGTTMLARILGSHSSIMMFNEMHYFGADWDPYDATREFSEQRLAALAGELLARQNHGLWQDGPSADECAWGRRLVEDLPEGERGPAEVFAAVLARLSADAGKTFPCEQTPRNIYYAERLLEIYPNARFVHIVRDPRAVLASQKNRWQVRRLGAPHVPISEVLRIRVNYHPYTMTNLWVKATDEALRLDGHARFKMVRFEDLAADAAGSIREVCSFLGLQFEPGMLHIPHWGSSNVVSDSNQKGVSAEVVSKWRDSLSPGEIRTCEKAAGNLMQKLGYATESPDRGGTLSLIPSLLSYPLHLIGVAALNPARAWIHVRELLRRGRTAPGS